MKDTTSATPPQPHERERDERRRGNIPVKDDLDIVPHPRRKFNQIRDDKTEREGQVEKKESWGHEIFFLLPLTPWPQERRDDERNQQPGVLEPEPDEIFRAFIPT